MVISLPHSLEGEFSYISFSLSWKTINFMVYLLKNRFFHLFHSFFGFSRERERREKKGDWFVVFLYNRTAAITKLSKNTYYRYSYIDINEINVCDDVCGGPRVTWRNKNVFFFLSLADEIHDFSIPQWCIMNKQKHYTLYIYLCINHPTIVTIIIQINGEKWGGSTIESKKDV